MLKRFENLGTALNRSQSKIVVGGISSAQTELNQFDIIGGDLGEAATCSGDCPTGTSATCEGTNCTAYKGGCSDGGANHKACA